jgi:hypothetical protein
MLKYIQPRFTGYSLDELLADLFGANKNEYLNKRYCFKFKKGDNVSSNLLGKTADIETSLIDGAVYAEILIDGVPLFRIDALSKDRPSISSIIRDGLPKLCYTEPRWVPWGFRALDEVEKITYVSQNPQIEKASNHLLEVAVSTATRIEVCEHINNTRFQSIREPGVARQPEWVRADKASDNIKLHMQKAFEILSELKGD